MQRSKDQLQEATLHLLHESAWRGQLKPIDGKKEQVDGSGRPTDVEDQSTDSI